MRRGQGLGPPPAVDRYQPNPAGWADLDHVIAHAEGGDTDCTYLTSR